MGFGVCLILLLSIASALVNANGTVNEVITWKSFQATLKSGIRSLLKYAMPTVIRGMSEANISSECQNSMLRFTLAISKLESWAVKMLDANGKVPSGILEGTIMDFGSMEECLRIKVHESSRMSARKEIFHGQYCIVGYHSPLMAPLNQNSMDGKNYYDLYGHPPEWAYAILERAGGYLKNSAFWIGTCVPSTCSTDDVKKAFEIITKPFGASVSIADCQVEQPYIWSTYATVSVVVLSCLAAICAVGTLLDAIRRYRTSNTTPVEIDNILLKISTSFSVLTNTEKLFHVNKGEESLSFFHGIRFWSATWIILGHTYFYNNTWKYMKSRSLVRLDEIFGHQLAVAVIENFQIPVGTFFFMSGFLLVYSNWRRLEKNDGKLNLLMFFAHKYWRMTPAIGLMLALFFCLPLIDSGPLWNSTLNPPLQNCRNLWWANLLYINNFWSVREYCLIHTWHMSALMQFHILGVLLLVIYYRWPNIGVLLGSLILIMCSIETALLTVWYNYPMPAPGTTKDVDIVDDYNSRLYIKPFAHFPTYVTGMVLAYVILQFHKKKLGLRYQVLGWTLSVTGALLSVYGVYAPSESLAIRVLYIVSHRTAWALSIGWLTYACATGIGGYVNRLLSWKAMSSLGQLSYLTYLLHPLVIMYKDASLRERVYAGHTELVFSYLSTLVISFFLAYVGYVVVEMPFSLLEKIVFQKEIKMNTMKKEGKEVQVISVKSIPNP